MNLLQLQAGTKSFGSRILFDKASFSVNEGEHLGVIGPNGAGKTTLFKILVGREELDSGEVTKKVGLRIGYLEQESEWAIEQRVEDYLQNECVTPIWELKQFGLKLGLKDEHFNAQLKSLSGGYRMRVKLLYLIGQQPDLLLLDEPTNFLDLETLIVLENFLQDFKGAFLLISHDREFLRRVTDHILEVEAGDMTKFPGSLDDYFEQKTMLREILQKQALSQEAKRKQVLDFANRFGAKATKARQAQSRLKQLEKMEQIEIKDLPSTSAIKIPDPIQTGKLAIECNNLDCGYQNKIILKNVSLNLERGQHLAIVGYNGAGKSTLLKTLAQEIAPLSGQLKVGLRVEMGYFSQHIPERLDPNKTVFEELSLAAHPSVTQQDVLNIAGSLLFSGDGITKKIRVLSGGEKSRVALGQVLLKKAPVLLLDEPTNHLDFDTVEALTAALEKYEGTVVIVSHDRSFIARVATQILEVQAGKLTLYPGTYDEYVWSLTKGVLADRASAIATPTKSQNSKEALASDGSSSAASANKINFKERKKQLETDLRNVQKKIRSVETTLAELASKRDLLTSELLQQSGLKAAESSKLLNQASQDIDANEEILLGLLEEEEQLKKDLEGALLA